MIAPTFSILALTMFASPSEQIGETAHRNPVLDIDACVEVDDASVENLVDLELGDARRGGRDVPISVGVRCLEGAQEIRVEPWASQGADGIRTIALPAVDDDELAAREARSRELALAIAELIRRLEITQPLHPPPPAPPPPPPVAVIVPTAPAAEEPRGRWQLAALSSFEAFTGGQTLVGGDIAVALAIGRLLLTEVRLGGRLVDADTPSVAHLTGRAGTAAVAAGPNVWSKQRAVRFALMLRAQGYAIEYRVESPGESGSRTSRLGALTVAVEPRLLVALSRRISLAAAAGVGIPLHGIVVRTQGTETDSLTGVVATANLGAAFTF